MYQTCMWHRLSIEALQHRLEQEHRQPLATQQGGLIQQLNEIIETKKLEKSL